MSNPQPTLRQKRQRRAAILKAYELCRTMLGQGEWVSEVLVLSFTNKSIVRSRDEFRAALDLLVKDGVLHVRETEPDVHPEELSKEIRLASPLEQLAKQAKPKRRRRS